MHYIEAKSSIDGWIDQVKTDIIARRDIRLSRDAQTIQDKATVHAQTYVDYLNGLFAQGAFPGAAAMLEVAKPFAESVTKIVLKFIEVKEDRDTTRLEGIVKQVEGLRWKRFEDL